MSFFQTHIDILTTDPGERLALVFGDCSLAEGVSPSRMIRFADVSPASAKAVSGIDIREFAQGVVIVVARSLAASQPAEVRRIQKYLAYCYVKYIWFAKQDSSTPDPLEIGGDKGELANLVYKINVQNNLPYLMTHPCANELTANAESFPVLLLLPGRSVELIGPRLAELAERYLVICLSKTLTFCRDHGVTPDVVVQLDTHGQQQNYYPQDMDLSQTWLLALSCAPGRRYFQRFAGVFWIDTFNESAYGGAHDIRNSWLSSFIPMLGAAEVLRPPRLLVAGSDLATDIGSKPEIHDEVDNIAAVNGWSFRTRTIDGSAADTTLQFLATAFEAETIASEMALNMGVACFNLTPRGILDPNHFEPTTPAECLDAPILERFRFRQTMQRAWDGGKRPDLRILKRNVNKQLNQARMLLRQVGAMTAMDDPAAMKGNPLLAASKLISHLHPTDDVRTLWHMSRKTIERYEAALVKRTAGFRLHDWVARGKAVPLLCLRREADELRRATSDRFPAAGLEVRHTWEVDASERGGYLAARQLPTFLKSVPLCLMSRSFLEAGDYLLSLLPMENVLVAEDVLDEPWP